MDIDNNEIERRACEAAKAGDAKLCMKLEDEFLAAFREHCETGDHCSCTAACRHHGNCKECVAIHRAHRDHIPNCFHDMMREKMAPLASLIEYDLRRD